MTRVRAAVVIALTFVTACAGPGGAAGAPIDESPPPRDVSPEGVPYPSVPVGVVPRARSRAGPGDRVPNLTFRGYKGGDRAAGLQVIALADAYDPTGTRVKVIHVMAAAAWCGFCQGQSRDMAAKADLLRRAGVVSVQALVHGPVRGKGPTLGELDRWLEQHATGFDVVSDGLGQKLSALAGPIDSVPWNGLIDARSMELLDGGLGAPPDFEAYVRDALDFVESNPPRD